MEDRGKGRPRPDFGRWRRFGRLSPQLIREDAHRPAPSCSWRGCRGRAWARSRPFAGCLYARCPTVMMPFVLAPVLLSYRTSPVDFFQILMRKVSGPSVAVTLKA